MSSLKNVLSLGIRANNCELTYRSIISQLVHIVNAVRLNK